jgi:uncharacterized caspase-like protein
VPAFLLGLLLISRAASGQEPIVVNVVKRTVTRATLPKLKARLVPIDSETPVALLLAKPQEDLSAYLVTFPSERAWYPPSRIQEEPNAITTAEIYQVALAQPCAERMSEIVQQLFPRTKVYPPGEPPRDESLRLRIRLSQGLIQGGETGLDGVKVRIELTLTDAEDRPIAVLARSGRGAPTKSFYWSLKNAWGEMGAIALTQAFDQLIHDLPANRDLKAWLGERAQARALPAGLTTQARFSDEGALLPDGRLDAGDSGALLIQVANQGPGSAYGVTVRVAVDPPQVTVSGNGTVGDLKPGESKEVALRVAGGPDLPAGVASLRIETEEKRGYGAQPVLFELATAKLVPPRLEIVDVTLSDPPTGGPGAGDGDGQPGNGETLEAVVRVRNAGPGEAVRVAVAMASPQAVAEVLVAKAVIPRIAVNRVEEARLLFRLPAALAATDLALSFQAVEARGAQIAAAAKEQTWKIRTKLPGIELAYRVYDGTSAGSTGNRDGLANNGERIEVTVTPTNRGELPARGVKIAVEAADPKLVPRPAQLDIGDLPVQAEGAAQRFTVEVPRTYDRLTGDLRFNLIVSQQSFPPRRELLALSYRGLRPQLAVETSAPAALTRGSGGEMELRLRNQGTLRAEEVSVEVTSKADGVDLLDERGVPVRVRKIALGVVEPQGAMAEQRLRVNVRRNAALGSALLHIAVSQKDFAPLAKDTAVTVTDEPAAVIAAARTDERALEKTAPPPPPAAPATISFLRNTSGEHLLAEDLFLRFEVQSPTELSELRLTQNDRLLRTDTAQRTAGVVGGLQVVQYEVPVRLEEGENRFEVVAVTRQGLRSARPLTLIRDPETGRIWLVAVGVSKYQDPGIKPLQYADADARSIYDYFRDTFGLPESQIFLRVNEQATLREVKSVLGTQLVTRANDPRDTVILYFAGHGMRDRVTGSPDPDGLSKYFLPYDTNRADLYSTALEMDEITNILRRLVPERVVVLLDTCFSGAAGGRSPFDPSAEGERALISGEFLDRMARNGKGRVVLTAGGPEEAAQESADFGHGVFTYYLLDGLHGAADMSGDGEIDVHEIYRYVSDKVARATRGRQNPKLKAPDVVGRILLGRGAARSRK